MKQVCILGAGWLGLDFVKNLERNDLFKVYYTKRNALDLHLNAVFESFEVGQQLPEFVNNQLDFLFLTISPGQVDFAELSMMLGQLKKRLSDECTLIFTSTIGVYQDVDEVVTEESNYLKLDSKHVMFECELQKLFSSQLIILRLGGLIDSKRHPVYYLSKKKEVENGQHPINLVHKDEILNFFDCILNENVPFGIYNLVNPSHPCKEQYYSDCAKQLGLPIPIFLKGSSQGKIVDSQNSMQIEGFSYKSKI